MSRKYWLIVKCETEEEQDEVEVILSKSNWSADEYREHHTVTTWVKRCPNRGECSLCGANLDHESNLGIGTGVRRESIKVYRAPREQTDFPCHSSLQKVFGVKL